MFFLVGFFGLLSLPTVRADGWDDFSNNLATDLAPFLSLFGEQITKQYLSESITTIDYFIFAMAPMGILTAVVSAIRVCGSPSLRAFIGRAQEGGGNAEAELCSSTSRDVCELYNNGGIARVFGRPKILEIVYDAEAEHKFTDGTAGIYTFREFVKKHPEKWSGPPDDSESIADVFAPNLSLNVGIKRKTPAVFWAVAITGMVLQAGVLVFAAIVTYHLHWEKDGSHPESYACPLTIIGTLLLCGGIFLCAFLVGQSTNERVFRKTQDDQNKQSTKENLYWVQPGGQVLGDQVFDAFCCSDHDQPLQEYITSWKNQSKVSELVVWAAVGTSIAGFVMQFVGLRAIHSAVSVAQLGVIMLMSAARAALRMQRLKPEDNFLSQCPDEVVGHELDWLALRIGEKDIQRDLKPSPGPSDPLRRQLWRFCGNTPDRKRGITPELPPPSGEPNVATKLLAYRTRLAQLTQSPTTLTKNATSAEHFGLRMVEVRENAQRLALAIESAANTIFSKSPRIGEEWKHTESMFWSFACEVVSAEPCNASKDQTSRHTVYLQLTRENPETPWRLKNRLELEGLLGLWVWSLKSDPAVETSDLQSRFTVSRATEVPARRIVSCNKNIAETDLKVWLGDKISNFTEHELRPTPIQRGDPSITKWQKGMEQDREVRFFGWHTAELSQSHEFVPFIVSSTSTTGSLLSLCTQEVFGFFIASMLDIVDDIGDISIQEPLHFRLENDLVSEIIKLFTQTQLGSKEDALLCVLPPMIPRLKLSSTGNAVGAAMTKANEHRRRGEWAHAETVLRWAWKICNESQPHPMGESCQNHESTVAGEQIQQAAISLGELYRWAIRSNDMKEFGLSGIKWLSNQKSSSKEPGPLAVGKIIDRYSGIIEAVEQGNNINGGGQLSKIKDDLNATLLYLTLSTSMTNEDKGKALCSAAKHGWAEVVLALLELGAEPDFKDPKQHSRTALSQAAEKGHFNTMKKLIDWGAFPNSADANHRTPLSYASEMGHNSAIEILLADQRVDPDTEDNSGRTPLLHAAGRGHEAVVKLLVKSGKVDLEAKDKDGQTLLVLAVERRYEAIVKLLVESGKVDLEARDKDGQTPLVLAVERGYEATVKLLVESGADVNAKDKDGQTPLLWAMRNVYRNEAVIKLLIDRGADLEAKDKDGRTLLSRAAGYGNKSVVKLLIDRGADLEAKDNHGQTPLLWAARYGDDAIVKLLVDRGVNLEAKDDNYEQTSLLWVAENGDEAVVKLLVDKGADLEAKNKYGRTPLSRAAGKGHKAVVKLLVDRGADREAKDYNGQTPMLWAAEEGHKKVVKLLEKQ
ncbi:hypothetical protein TrVGV298_011960 [Trichoderma virens]|nr:hypothetical protein TrVGV298_011960 [Trichoderma virens]